jgi:hypothetical protein
MKMTDTTFLTRVRLKNYKSIAVRGRREEQFSRCASHYSDALRTTLDQALREQVLDEPAHFAVQNGRVVGASAAVSPPAANDRLYIVNAAGLKEFRPL